MRYNPLLHGHPQAWDIERMYHKGKSAKMPKAPDYAALAEQQAASSKANVNAQTVANRPNQVSGQGSVNWSQDPTTGQWTQTTALDKDLLAGQDAQQRTQTGIAQGAEGLYKGALAGIQNPLDTSGMPAWGDPSHQSVKDVQDATYQLMAPELLRQRKAAENQLITQGVGRGANEAWTQGQRVLGSNENDAILKSILAGTTEAGNVFNRQNKAHENVYNQAVADRTRPMAELGGLMGLGANQFDNPNMPDFAQAGLPDTTQYMDAGQQQYNAAMAKANAKNKGKSSGFGGLMQLGKIGLSAYGNYATGGASGAALGAAGAM